MNPTTMEELQELDKQFIAKEDYIWQLRVLIREVERTNFMNPKFNQQMSQAQFNRCIAKALTYITNYQNDIHERQE